MKLPSVAKLFGKLKPKGKFLNIFILLGIVVLVGILMKYNNQKLSLNDGMSNPFANVGNVESAPAKAGEGTAKPAVDAAAASAGAAPVSTTDGNQFLAVSGMSSGNPRTRATINPSWTPRSCSHRTTITNGRTLCQTMT